MPLPIFFFSSPLASTQACYFGCDSAGSKACDGDGDSHENMDTWVDLIVMDAGIYANRQFCWAAVRNVIATTVLVEVTCVQSAHQSELSWIGWQIWGAPAEDLGHAARAMPAGCFCSSSRSRSVVLSLLTWVKVLPVVVYYAAVCRQLFHPVWAKCHAQLRNSTQQQEV